MKIRTRRLKKEREREMAIEAFHEKWKKDELLCGVSFCRWQKMIVRSFFTTISSTLKIMWVLYIASLRSWFLILGSLAWWIWCLCYCGQGIVNECRVTDLSLSEFLLYGPQKDAEKIGKTLMRKSKDGKVLKWDVDLDDSLCTLQEAFERVEQTLGFNIELKFDDHTVYEREFLVHVLRSVLQVYA